MASIYVRSPRVFAERMNIASCPLAILLSIPISRRNSSESLVVPLDFVGAETLLLDEGRIDFAMSPVYSSALIQLSFVEFVARG